MNCLLGLCFYALHNNAVTIDAFCVALFALRLLGGDVGCPCVRVFIHLFICCSVCEALCFVCVATLNINTPTSFIVNFALLCFLVCGFSWLCRLTVCELQAGESCALKLGEN